MDVISLLIFLVLIALSFLRKVNMGVLAFGTAMILGRVLGIGDKEVIKSLSTSLFITLTGITLLFAAVNSTGAFELVSNKIVLLAGKKIWLLPIVAYLVGFILAAIGPGAIPPTTLVVTLTVSIAVSSGYNPIMMGIIGGLGLMGGRAFVYTPEGALITTLATEQGLSKNIIYPVFVFQILTTILMAIALFFIYKGYKVKCPECELNITKVKVTTNQIVALLSVLAMLISVVVLNYNVGLVSFLLAGVLFLMKIADDGKTIKSIPWGTIVMVLGVGVLMTVISKAGGIDLLTNLLSKIMDKNTVAPLTGVTAGIMSLVSSGLGVVYPTLIPLSTNLVETVGGGNAVSVIAAIVAGGSLAGFSPMSTCGALTLGAMATMNKDMTKEESSRSFFQLFLIAIGAVLWVGLSTFLFANLIVGMFAV